MAKDVMEQIIAEGAVTRGYIGIEPQDITPALAESLKLKNVSGALVAKVVRGSPAEKAGVKAGDVITSIESKGIQDSVAAMSVIAGLKPGQDVKFQVTRSEKVIDLAINVAKRPRAPRLQRQ